MRALITGASRGIGLEMARQIQARGDTVIGTSRHGDTPLPGVDWRKLDVAVPDEVSRLAQQVDAPLDLLVCNAGVYLDKLQELETGFAAPLWAQSFAVNVTGVFLTIQALLPHLRAAKGAKVAIIGSQMGSDTKAPGGSYIYRASKAAALNLGRNLAVDLKPDGIALGIYHPGWVQTNMGGKAADITPRASATAMLERFAELDLATTGCFLTWDGHEHPY